MIAQFEGLPPVRYELRRCNYSLWTFYACCRWNGEPFDITIGSKPYQNQDAFLSEALTFTEKAFRKKVAALQAAEAAKLQDRFAGTGKKVIDDFFEWFGHDQDCMGNAAWDELARRIDLAILNAVEGR